MADHRQLYANGENLYRRAKQDDTRVDIWKKTHTSIYHGKMNVCPIIALLPIESIEERTAPKIVHHP